MDRIIRYINKDRTDEQKIDIAKGYFSCNHQNDLLHALRKLGGIIDIFTSADTTDLMEFQNKMDKLLYLHPDHPESIESILAREDSQIARIMEEVPRIETII